MSYTIEFDYDSSLTEYEVDRLKAHQSEFEASLQVPCGVTGKVKWLARSYNTGGRQIELRTHRDNYLLFEFSSRGLSTLNQEWIHSHAENDISNRWPKDPKYFDEHFFPSKQNDGKDESF